MFLSTQGNWVKLAQEVGVLACKIVVVGGILNVDWWKDFHNIYVTVGIKKIYIFDSPKIKLNFDLQQLVLFIFTMDQRLQLYRF